MKPRAVVIAKELGDHLPYAIASILIAVGVLGALTFLTFWLDREALLPSLAQGLFHLFHPVHLFFSAVATTAMFWRHERRFVKAVMIGFVGSVGICGVSDIVIPFVGGLLLQRPMQLHLCLAEHPLLVLPFVLVGIVTGWAASASVEHTTLFSHAAHVFTSSLASVLYLVSFGVGNWLSQAGLVFLIIVFAVLIPCCFSDVGFPLLAVHRPDD